MSDIKKRVRFQEPQTTLETLEHLLARSASDPGLDESQQKLAARVVVLARHERLTRAMVVLGERERERQHRDVLARLDRLDGLVPPTGAAEEAGAATAATAAAEGEEADAADAAAFADAAAVADAAAQAERDAAVRAQRAKEQRTSRAPRPPKD